MDSVRPIVDMIDISQNLTELKLSGTGLDVHSLYLIANALNQKQRIEVLDLSGLSSFDRNLGFADSNFQLQNSVFKVVQIHTLTDLNLSGIQIQDVGIDTIIKALQPQRPSVAKLQTLRLNCCGLRDRALEKLTSLFQGSSQLKLRQLELRGN